MNIAKKSIITKTRNNENTKKITSKNPVNPICDRFLTYF